MEAGLMSKLIKTKDFNNLIYDYVLEFGLQVPTNPIDAVKLGLQKLKDKKEEQFINNVIEDIINIDTSGLKAEKTLERLYKSLQVISKATTQEKINRFKKLTVNGIIYQNESSDNDFELFLNILDSLTEYEFVILSIMHQLYPNILIHQKIDESIKFGQKIEMSSLFETTSKLKENRQQIAITEKNLISLIEEATNLNQENISYYKNTLNSKGLIETEILLDGCFCFKNISVIGQKFMEFINKEGYINEQ